MMLPMRRREWLSGRTKYEITSITASTILSATVGALETQNSLRKPAPCLTKPMTVTVTNTAIASTAVTAICDIAAKLRRQSARAGSRTG